MKCIFSFLFEESGRLSGSQIKLPSITQRTLWSVSFCYRADFLIQNLSLEFHTFAPSCSERVGVDAGRLKHSIKGQLALWFTTSTASAPRNRRVCGQGRGEVRGSVRWEQGNIGREKLLSISFLTSLFQARESVCGCVGVRVCMCVYVCHIHLLLSCSEMSTPTGLWSPGLLLSLSVGMQVCTTMSGTYVVSWAHTQVLLLVR